MGAIINDINLVTITEPITIHFGLRIEMIDTGNSKRLNHTNLFLTCCKITIKKLE